MANPFRSTWLMISYILLKSPQTSTHKKVYVNTHKICRQVFWTFLQPSLRWILKKEQRSWLPHNLKYVGKIGYRTLHPSFFFHFLDAKATLCWPNKKVDTMLTLRLFLKNIRPSHVLSRKEQSYPFFFSDKSTKCCFQDCEATFLKWRDQPNVELQNGASNLLPKKEHRLRNGEISSFCDIQNADEFEKPPVRTS